MEKFDIVKSYYVHKGKTLYKVEILETEKNTELNSEFYAVISNKTEEYVEKITSIEKADFEVEQHLNSYLDPKTKKFIDDSHKEFNEFYNRVNNKK